jgi:hypothetical protein
VATGILHNPNCVTKKPDDTIYFYSKTNKWAFLSNFWICDILIDGKTYKSTEHYFQAMKFVDPKIQQEIQESTSPSTVYKLANSRTGKYKEFIKINWENIKDQVMKDALRAKFTQNADLKKKLIETGNVKLVEASPTDSYWGHGKDKKGLNKLGKLLEEIRDEIKQKIDL